LFLRTLASNLYQIPKRTSHRYPSSWPWPGFAIYPGYTRRERCQAQSVDIRLGDRHEILVRLNSVSKSYILDAFRRRAWQSRRQRRPPQIAPKNRPILQIDRGAAVFGPVRFWAPIGQRNILVRLDPPGNGPGLWVCIDCVRPSPSTFLPPAGQNKSERHRPPRA
jgi:hypothetical protein